MAVYLFLCPTPPLPSSLSHALRVVVLVLHWGAQLTLRLSPVFVCFLHGPPPTSHPHALIHYLHGPCSILSQSIVASLVSIRLLLHSALKFENEDGVTGNKVSKEIGNVTADTTLSFE